MTTMSVLRPFSAVAAALVVAMALAASPAAAQPPAAVTGTLRNAAGAPLGSVTITVVNLDTRDEREVITQNDGSFTVGGLEAGRYQIRIQESGYAPYQGATLTLAAGQRVRADLTLQPAAAPATPPPAAQPQQPPRPAQPPARPATPPPATPPPAPAPPPTPAPKPVEIPDYIPSPDRWRLEFPVWQRYPPELGKDYPYVTGSKLDPYNRNVLKGDYPVVGNDIFFVFTAISETPFEYRRVPTPGGVSTERPQTEGFFGKGEQYSVAPEAIISFELFKGDTSFKPRTWALRVTPVFNLNYVNVGERNIVTVTPESGTTRRRTDFAIQEGFGEVKLTDVGSNYDFISVRAGIQPFTSDFRGFLYRDTNLGVRLFGTWGRNRNQWHVAAFDQLEKETNSELNTFDRRKQKVIIANYFRQDFLTQGYTISPSFHANFDDGDEFHFDENGFLVRPSPIGLIAPHRVKAYYVGLGGDGHWGPINVSHQFYQAFGTDDFNGISGSSQTIKAQFGAAEFSVDHDWWRIKGTFIYASGDQNPDDDKAQGFDAIFDNPNIAGGPFSFWNRVGVRLTGTG